MLDEKVKVFSFMSTCVVHMQYAKVAYNNFSVTMSL